jgi:hypothetical protein
MASASVQAMYPFASPLDGTPVILILLPYAGTLHVGLDTDSEAFPGPEHITELTEQETVAMARLAGTAESA